LRLPDDRVLKGHDSSRSANTRNLRRSSAPEGSFSLLRLSSVLRVAVLLLFAAALATPLRVLAQEHPAPAANAPSASDAQGLPAQPGQEKKEEEEEHNLFRHTALVSSISDAIFHDDKNATDPEKVELRDKHIEETARIFEWINAAIILLCIIIPLARFLPKVIRKRQLTLSHNLETARKTSADADARLSAVEAQLSRLDDEIAKIRTQVEEESKQDEVRIKASIEEERARIVTAAEQEITAAAAHARRGLRNFAADLAIEQAAKQLVLTPETDRALIAEFISEAHNDSGNGANGASRGGKK
jgi:F-type H+-transporting ATPase subunit b